MGCLNSQGKFNHWFGNIHLSGPCNRSCYFCIGQYMMALDAMNNLDLWPLKNIDGFVTKCREKNVLEVNLTGSNTDPLLFRHHVELTHYLRDMIPGVTLGLRTNGVSGVNAVGLYDKASISVSSFDNNLYAKTMGRGSPPNVAEILRANPKVRFKLNVVLCEETISSKDFFSTLDKAVDLGLETVNLREPYGQPHIGDPLSKAAIRSQFLVRVDDLYGMHRYSYMGMEVVYWDVHYVEVESINLYANGVVSETYPVTKGHHESGQVIGQEYWTHGRHIDQWVSA